MARDIAFLQGGIPNSHGLVPNQQCNGLRHSNTKCTTLCTASSKAPKRSRRSFLTLAGNTAVGACLAQSLGVEKAIAAKPEGVNRPDLLPKEFTTVIDLERFMVTGEVRRLKERIAELERRTGFKIRVLTQKYPQTPGLAIRDYWNVDANTVVMVADYFGGSGQLIKYNVGANVDKLLPVRFWSMLSANFGNKFYVEKNSESAAIINSIESIRVCLLRDGCAVPPDLNHSF